MFERLTGLLWMARMYAYGCTNNEHDCNGISFFTGLVIDLF